MTNELDHQQGLKLLLEENYKILNIPIQLYCQNKTNHNKRGDTTMKKLIRCVFCNQVIPFEELGYKDEEGYWCKRDWKWMQSFLKLWRDSHA